MKTLSTTLLVTLAVFISCPVRSQIDKIESFIKMEMGKKKIVGLQLAIVKGGRIVNTGNYGYANIQDSIKVDSKTVFTINSITKAFTGVAIMQLVEEGKVNLGAPISTYLTDLPILWRKVTVQQLASHISGIPDIMDNDANMIAENEEASWKKVQMLKSDFKVGERFSYNQTNYLLLGKIIEKLSGMPFVDFISNNQLKKIGMANTGFGDTYDVVSHSARGYTFFRNGKLTNVNEVFLPIMRTAAGMYSTATEMANWVIALQSKQLLKKDESLSALWAPALLNNGKTQAFSDLLNGYAIGWMTVSRANHPAYATVGGGRSALFIYPKDDLTIIILTNTQGASPENFMDEFANFISLK
jgi:CubicO group peptidase (beta-lactamase class C family)